MSFVETKAPPSRTQFAYKNPEYGRIFDPSEIGKYSSKIKEDLR